MTKLQQAALDYVTAFIDENGYGPSVRELAAAMGWSSPSTAQDILVRLRTAGYVTWKPGSNRTLRVLQGGSPS